MIEDDVELDALEKELQEKRIAQSVITQERTAFSKTMDDVKQRVLTDASANDEKFVKTVVENVKDAAVKYTEVEQSKASLERQKVSYESEKLNTQQLANVNRQLEDKWINKQKQREYHYNGVKPIMTFVGINEPMNLLFLYFLSLVLIVPFLVSKLFKGTIGALLCGAEDSDRSKAARGLIWTIIAMIIAFILFCGVYLFFMWQGIDILSKLKS